VDQRVSEQLLNEAFEDFAASTHAQVYGWKISREDLDIFVEMTPRGKTAKYLLRIRCREFPVEPPSYQFVDPQTKKVDWSHFPKGSAFKKQWLGICINGTREFYQRGHPERRKDWSYGKYPFAAVTQEIQVLMNRL